MSNEMEQYEDKAPEHVQERPWVAPRVDIYENEDELLLLADVPGVNREGLSINLDKEQLSLEGKVDEETPGTPLGREFRGVDYRRNFVVPAGIDGSMISAELKDGVLRLHLPKAEALKPRQIQVRAG